MSIRSQWVSIAGAELRRDFSETLDPRSCGDEEFDLYSVPACLSGVPEVVRGSSVGSHKQTVVPGTVLVCKINPRINRVWVVGPSRGVRQIASTEWIPFFPVSGVEPRFLAFQFNMDAFRNHLAANVSGVGGSLMRVRPSVVDYYQILVAPSAEQDRIVRAIESHLSLVDEAIVTLERVQRNLKRYRASVLRAAVEGRLVPTESEVARAEGRGFEPAAALLARTQAPPRPNRWNSRSTDVVPGHPALAVGSPGSTLPEGWAWSALADVARMESGHTPSRSHSEWWGGEVAWITLSDARAHDGSVILDTEERTNAAGLENSAARLLPGGTVCISRTASVGYVVVMGREMATSQDFVNWTPTEAVTSDWLRIVFTADREALRRFGKGTVHKTIYFPEWLSIHVAVPPLREQHRLAAEADRLLTIAATQESAIKLERVRLGRLRQSILKWAFEGRLVDQDPRDEPAAVLLERIKAECASAAPMAISRAKKPRAKVAR